MKNYLKEATLIVLMLTPFLYLLLIWDTLPEQIPIHFDLYGNPDRWGSKYTLLFIPFTTGVLIYFLLLIVPLIDPKQRIKEMGEKYYALRLITQLFMTLLTVYIINASAAGDMGSPQFIFGMVGALFALLGNYFQTVRPNYFVGIRTPWTLENETVWKKTHYLAGRLWLVGGLVIVLFSVLSNSPKITFIAVMVITGLITIVPIIYSYILFQQLGKSDDALV